MLGRGYANPMPGKSLTCRKVDLPILKGLRPLLRQVTDLQELEVFQRLAAHQSGKAAKQDN